MADKRSIVIPILFESIQLLGKPSLVVDHNLPSDTEHLVMLTENPMPNEDHLAILQEGVAVWNDWREKHSEIRPNLSRADLPMQNLAAVNLSRVNLTEADFSGADLSRADLREATLVDARLVGANLSNVDLRWASLMSARLVGANLSRANLSPVHLYWANLSGADLTMADLTDARLGGTVFGDIDLSTVKGLETVRHQAPSEIGIKTIYYSQGNIPEIFLRGCGVPEDFITYMHSMTANAFDFYSCFISYSSGDQAFAERLHNDLQSNGVRVWFAPEDLRIGDRFRTRIDEAIRIFDKLIVVLSTNSIHSDWVEKEVETAMEKERNEKRAVLFPIRLDNEVMTTGQAWAADIRRTRHVGDFTKWKNHDDYQKAFERLLRDLNAVTQTATS